MLFRPIAINLSPNTQFDDILICLKVMISFWNWKKGKSLYLLTDWFKNYYGTDKIYFFNSGRSALYFLLKSFGLGSGDEVIIQGFTCVAVPDPIIWVGAKPVYADIDASLNINPSKILKLISRKTKAIIVQHTFGIPAEISAIKKIAQKYNIILIEDCAHSLGATYNSERIGKFGDASFFSFGRDKVISSVFGGAAIINNKIKFNANFEKIYNRLPYPDNSWLFKQLFHPLAFCLILPLYNFFLGKLLLYFLIRFKLLSKPVEKTELTGRLPKIYPAKMPNGLAVLAFNQILKLDKYNQKRKKLANIYFKNLSNIPLISLPVKKHGSIFLRFNILVNQRDNLLIYFRKRKILLGSWYSNIIDPKGADFEKLNYLKGSLPATEYVAEHSLNLPTYPLMTEKNALFIVELLKKNADKRNT